MGSHNFINLRTMKFLITTLFFVLSLAYISHAADIVVDIDMDEVSESEMNGAHMDRTVVCQFFGNGRCATACAGQLCTSTCQAPVDSSELLPTFVRQLQPQLAPLE